LIEVGVAAGAEFALPSCYSYWTVASPSCHDTSTLRAWYNEDAARRERFYYRCLDGAAPARRCCAAVSTQFMRSTRACCAPARAAGCPHVSCDSQLRSLLLELVRAGQALAHAKRSTLPQSQHSFRRAGQGDAPQECTPAIVHKVADQHLTSPAIFCIMPLQVLPRCGRTQ
jgi:4-alpha-glucanotransferase